MTANRTFLGSVHRNQPEQYEAPAGAALTPGMLAQVTAGELVPHVDAGFVYVAKELTANFAPGGGVNEDYETGDTAQAYIPVSGEMYRMLAATGQEIGVDTPLESNGEGLLVVQDAGDAVCFADEDAGTTDGTTPIRVKFK